MVLTDNTIKIPKLSAIKARIHRELVGTLKSITISKSVSGKYFASPFMAVSNQNRSLNMDLKHWIGTVRKKILGFDPSKLRCSDRSFTEVIDSLNEIKSELNHISSFSREQINFTEVIDSLNEIKSELNHISSFSREQINGRLLTLEWLANNNRYEVSHIMGKVEGLEVGALSEQFSTNQHFTLECEQYLALDSNDYLEPESTVEGLTSGDWFVHESVKLFKKDSINFLDIGCGGGGLTFNFMKNGHFSVGLDGSDYCKNLKKGYWNIPNLLNNADVTKPFLFKDKDDNGIEFDIITMWEVFEHIPEELISGVLQNIYCNISHQGYFIGSISTIEYVNSKTGTVYHVTLKDIDWWKEKFRENGLEFIPIPIPVQSCYRGVGNRYQDPHSYIEDPSTGFHFSARLCR